MRGAGSAAPRRSLLLGLLLLLAVAAVPGPLTAAEVPYLAGRVNDTAGLLSPGAKQRLEEKLRGLQERTGAEVVVLTVPSLGGEPLEDYAVRVAQTWKLGQQGKDNGALLLVSSGDRKMRIESGYGLEAQLTDLKSKEIIDDVIRPRFQDGDFEGGIEAGTDAIGAIIEGKPMAVAEKPPGGSAADLPMGPRIGFGLIFLVVVGIFSLAALFSAGCQSWFLYAFLTPFYFALPSALFGPAAGTGFALGWLIGFPVLRLLLGRGGRGGPRGGGGGRGRGVRSWPVFTPWVLGGGAGGGGGWSSRGGGWSGGGGGGFGGFSGGGGSFGGGGASGSW